MPISIHIDGGARGNPGPAACGVVIRDLDHDLLLHEAGYYLGTTTNNEAEYQGLLHALEVALEIGAKDIRIIADSQLMVRQVLGQYKVKAPNLKPLHAKAQTLLAKFDDWSFDHVLRHLNKRADELANMAMDVRKNVPGDATKTPVLSGKPATKPQKQDDLFDHKPQEKEPVIKVLSPAPCCVRYAKTLAQEDAGKQRCPECGALLQITF
ncbi:MAG: ribonuclease HI family protein [Phycisphaeraceae bacterium JB051]